MEIFVKMILSLLGRVLAFLVCAVAGGILATLVFGNSTNPIVFGTFLGATIGMCFALQDIDW